MAEFDKFAQDYQALIDDALKLAGEGSAYFAMQKAHYLARRLPDLDGKLLDFGCGIGLLSGALRTLLPRAELHGFDISADSIAKVPPALREGALFTTDLGELAEDYQAIVVANVLHHISPSRRDETLAGLVGRLAPGGRLIIIEHNPLNPATRYIVARCPLDEHAVLLPVREARRRLRGAGLRLERRDYIAFFPRPARALRPLETYLTWLPLGAQYAVVARRYG